MCVRFMLAIGVLATFLVGPTGEASAANGRIGVRETVCADTLALRVSPGGGWDGYLKYPQTFLVKGPREDGYIYGYAYGNLNRHGWVQDGWFC